MFIRLLPFLSFQMQLLVAGQLHVVAWQPGPIDALLPRPWAGHREHVFDDVAMPRHVELRAATAVALRDVMEGELIPNTNLKRQLNSCLRAPGGIFVDVEGRHAATPQLLVLRAL